MYCGVQECPVINPTTIVRCRVCRAYINPFVVFIDSRHWRCNLCFRPNTRNNVQYMYGIGRNASCALGDFHFQHLGQSNILWLFVAKGVVVHWLNHVCSVLPRPFRRAGHSAFVVWSHMHIKSRHISHVNCVNVHITRASSLSNYWYCVLHASAQWEKGLT